MTRSWCGRGELQDEIQSGESEYMVARLAPAYPDHDFTDPWYDRQRPDVFATALSGAKTAFDPSGILNPGILL